MRILHLINGEYYAGAERVQDLLALRLPEYGFEVGFACLKPLKFPAARLSRSAALHLLPMRGRFDLSCGMKLMRLVREQGYALVHSHSPRGAMVGRVGCALAGVPMIHHVHSPTARDSESEWRNRFNSWIQSASLGRAERLIAVSSSLGRYLQDAGFDVSRIRVVPNGVPADRSLPAREVLGKEWVLGAVALFRPRKGIEVLIEALARLRGAGYRARLRCVGPFETPAYEQHVLRLAKQLAVADLIDWTGFTKDVDGELARMDVLVVPSLYGEGMPMVMLEAMAKGVPVVATDVEGIGEVIEHGQSGLIVPPGDVEALVASLAAVMDGLHDWQALRRAAWIRQRDHFSDRSMALAVAEVYREVLRNG